MLLSAITKAFTPFELDINVEKTAILGVGEVVSPEWLSPLRNFRLSNAPKRQQADLEHYFKNALFLAENNPRDRVLVYAVKRTRSFRIDSGVWPYYVNFLLRLCRRDPSCIPHAAQIIIEGNFNQRPIDRALIKKFIRDTIRFNGEIHNYFEVSWALFIAKALRIEIEHNDLGNVFKAESSVCGLLIMDLNARNLIKGGIDVTFWNSFYSPEGLRSSMWLLVWLFAFFSGWI